MSSISAIIQPNRVFGTLPPSACESKDIRQKRHASCLVTAATSINARPDYIAGIDDIASIRHPRPRPASRA